MNNINKYKHYVNNLKKYKLFTYSLLNKFIEVPELGTNYIPQGVCIVDNYSLITFYDWTKTNNSIVTITELHTNKVRKVYLDGKYHCGGLSYHKQSNSIYITGASGLDNGRSAYINKYNFNDFLTQNQVTAISKFQVDNNNTLKSAINNRSSVAYLTIHNNELYLGNFANKDSKIKKYLLNPKGDLITTSVTTLNNPYKNTQGISKYIYQNEEYYLFSTSYNRFKDSIIYLSKLTNNQFNTIKKIKFPVMSEQLNFTDSKELYLLFESGHPKHKYAKNKIKDICFLDFTKLKDF